MAKIYSHCACEMVPSGAVHSDVFKVGLLAGKSGDLHFMLQAKR